MNLDDLIDRDLPFGFPITEPRVCEGSGCPCYDSECNVGDCKNITAWNYDCSIGLNDPTVRCKTTTVLQPYTCDCPDGFSGLQCETNINECANKPCKNAYFCKDGVNDYTCGCKPGFEGKNCETNINECANKPCKNDAYCKDGANDYTCGCKHGFEGKNCENGTCEGWASLNRGGECGTARYINPDAINHILTPANEETFSNVCCNTFPSNTGGGDMTCAKWAFDKLNNSNCDFGYVSRFPEAGEFVLNPPNEAEFRDVCCKPE
jgi:hypothetical protein